MQEKGTTHAAAVRTFLSFLSSLLLLLGSSLSSSLVRLLTAVQPPWTAPNIQGLLTTTLSGILLLRYLKTNGLIAETTTQLLHGEGA
jgi:hypothetical protein